jgi:signal transduction histidine kinase
MPFLGRLKLSIQTKVMTFVALIVVVSIFALTVALISISNAILFKEFKLRSQSIAQASASNLELPLLTSNQQELDRLRLSLLNIPDVDHVDINNNSYPNEPTPSNRDDILAIHIPIFTEAAPTFEIDDGDNIDGPVLISKQIGNLDIHFSTNKFSAHVEETVAYASVVAGITLIIALIIAYYLMKTVTSPLNNLVRITKRVEDGDLDQQMPVDSGDEIAELAHSFNSMIVSLKERSNDLRNANKKLANSNEDLDKFAHIVSHDLGAPLRRITDFTRMLKRDTQQFDNPRINKLSDKIADSANHGMEMMNGLLQLSRVSTRSKPLTQVSLQKVLSKLTDDLDLLIRKSSAEINISPLPTIDADEMQMYQLFQNLITNAIKYRKDELTPVIDISSTTNGRYTDIYVRDNGIGFDAKHTENIFQVFTRLHRNEDQYSGHGVGLSICDRIVKRLKGEISADSTPGEGTCFHIHLPLNQPDETNNGAQ